jgi:hypothetical protein
MLPSVIGGPIGWRSWLAPSGWVLVQQPLFDAKGEVVILVRNFQHGGFGR